LPLDFDAIRNSTFVLRDQPHAQTNDVVNGLANGTATNGASKSVDKFLNGANGSASRAAGLKDQRSLTLGNNLALFVSSTDRLTARLRAGDTISFDKDDDDTLDFVTAAANLRSFAYTIECKTRWEVKRNGQGHHSCHSHNERSHLWPHCLASTSPTSKILQLAQERSSAIQAQRSIEHNYYMSAQSELRHLQRHVYKGTL